MKLRVYKPVFIYKGDELIAGEHHGEPISDMNLVDVYIIDGEVEDEFTMFYNSSSKMKECAMLIAKQIFDCNEGFEIKFDNN